LSDPASHRASGDDAGRRILVHGPRGDVAMGALLAAARAAPQSVPRGIHLLAFHPMDEATIGSRPPSGAGVSSEATTIVEVPFALEPGVERKLALRLALDEGFAGAALLADARGLTLDDLGAFVGRAVGDDCEALFATAEAGRGRWVDRLASRCTGLPAADFAAPLRFFSRRLLERIPFEANSDGAEFDLEILFQADYVGARIDRVSIGAPAARLSVRQTVRAALRYGAHRIGMLCSLRFRHLQRERYRDKTSTPYSSHALALEIVRRLRPARVLDLGCGAGFVAQRCEQLGAAVTGVDATPPRDGMMSRFVQLDLERQPLPVDPSDFDLVLLLDVVEHLEDPEEFLLRLRNRSARSAAPGSDRAPLVVLSTPNVAFAAIRWNLLFGRFNYAERGILDITHKRLFTRGSLRRLLADCGYRIERIRPVAVPFGAVVGGRLGHLLERGASVLARLRPTLFGFQFLVTCRPSPNAQQILARSRERVGDDGGSLAL